MQYRYRRRQERGPVPDVDNKQGAGNGCINRTVSDGLQNTESSAGCTSAMYGRGDHLSGTDGTCRLEIVGGRWIKRHIIFMDQ